MSAPIEIESIRRLNVKPGETLVVTVAHDPYTSKHLREIGDQWLAGHGKDRRDVRDLTVTDGQVTITYYRLNAEGKRYSHDGDHVAMSYLTVPLDDAPAWLAEVAG